MKITVVGPHPDDQELGMGGTIATLAHQGHEVTLLDLTDGEPTPCGDPETSPRDPPGAPLTPRAFMRAFCATEIEHIELHSTRFSTRGSGAPDLVL